MIDFIRTFAIPDAVIGLLRIVTLCILAVGTFASLKLDRYGHAFALVMGVLFFIALLDPQTFGQGFRIAAIYSCLITFGFVPIWHFLRR